MKIKTLHLKNFRCFKVMPMANTTGMGTLYHVANAGNVVSDMSSTQKRISDNANNDHDVKHDASGWSRGGRSFI